MIAKPPRIKTSINKVRDSTNALRMDLQIRSSQNGLYGSTLRDDQNQVPDIELAIRPDKPNLNENPSSNRQHGRHKVKVNITEVRKLKRNGVLPLAS